MKHFIPLLRGLLSMLVVVGYALALAGCATERVPLAIDAQVDSALVAAGVPPLSVRRIKFTGPVSFQIGGTNNTATSTAIGKAKAPVAAAPNAHAASATTKTGPPWQVYALGALVLVAGGFYARGKLQLPLL